MKEDLKILLFLCNWGPHPAFQKLQERGYGIPLEVRMVRIPCTGRITKALLFKAFEMGSDGVVLAGCESGQCRYGKGTENARKNVEDTRGILDLLGLGKERLRWVQFMPQDADLMSDFLKKFSRDIERIGKSPVHLKKRGEITTGIEDMIKEILVRHDIYACQDCGKCSSACPLALSGKPFSPRSLASSIIAGQFNSTHVIEEIFSCLTCGLCYDRCPSAVDFPEFIQSLRQIEMSGGMSRFETHGGFFHSLMRTMTSPDLIPKPWQWLPKDIKINQKSNILFFGGCAPYFDIFFHHHLGVRTRDILRDSLRLLNFFDIYPSILESERCCGHDLLWSGDRENFFKLAMLNIEALEKMGAEEVVVSCPECYRTIKSDYKRLGLDLKFKVTHIYEILLREIEKGAVGFKSIKSKLTFQDPCRLSRFENRPDLPRRLINLMNLNGFREMKENGRSSICCGNCAWIGCDSYSKALQVNRLRQAHDTGSEILITGCPKCQIHFQCAMEDPHIGREIRIDMMDLISLVARTIFWK